MVCVLIIFALTLPYLLDILKMVFIPKPGGFWGHEITYMWVMVGGLITLLLRLMIRSKSCFIETFSHEFTHAIVAFFLGRKVHSFHVEDSGSGMIFTSGDRNYSLIPVALAPYCLPIFTYILLVFRCIVADNHLWICDTCIGMTLCFHYYCFKTQIGNHQTDINQYPLSFSYSYIVTAWLVNVCVILVSFDPDMIQKDIWGKEVFSSVLLLIIKWWENAQFFLHLFF